MNMPPLEGVNWASWGHGGTWPLLLLALGIGYLAWVPIYNMVFHPLRRYPGPKSWAATNIPYAQMVLSGQGPKRILKLHQKYGDIVRVAPDELSYLDAEAWKDAMGHRKSGQGENGKDPVFYQISNKSMIAANREDHARMRRLLAHAFSAQSMVQQQPLIRGYVDSLLQGLNKNCENGARPLDMAAWYNWTTFDVIGDLAFGEPFGCLSNSDYHPWVKFIFDRIRAGSTRAVLARFPIISGLMRRLVFRKIQRSSEAHMQLTKERVAKRLSLGTPRADFVESMARQEEHLKMSKEEITSTASTLIIAGSETTATALSGATFYLTVYPEILAKLTEEVRSMFSSEEEIDLLSVQKLRYMLAVLDETLRLYPPVPGTFPRIAQPGGDVICGQFVPEGTRIGIWQWALYHSSTNFTLPESFIPERWLGDPRFANDRKDVFQPFSVGSRNCIGRNLAYAEMRMILARVIWKFDMTLAEESKNWINESEIYTLWQKPPLWVHLTPRKMS